MAQITCRIIVNICKVMELEILLFVKRAVDVICQYIRIRVKTERRGKGGRLNVTHLCISYYKWAISK